LSKDIIVIDYFTDILCIWAYAAQKRVDEIKKKYDKQVEFRLHFISIFGSIEQKIATTWKEKGIKGYHDHVQSVSNQFDFLDVHPELWLKDNPKSSLNIHISLKAAQLLIDQGKIDASQFDNYLWQCRLAFFKDAINIGQREIMCDIATSCSINVDDILENIETGAAHAAFEEDRLLATSNQIDISPAFLLNNGRQKLYGNVGYRIIDVNIQTILDSANKHGASWC
jgi:predicted DsbA family dithiol-disulfide isomerase